MELACAVFGGCELLPVGWDGMVSLRGVRSEPAVQWEIVEMDMELLLRPPLRLSERD
jgi:hypothetical protein